MLKAVVVRLYPTPDQARFLRGQFGAVRFVWNKALFLKLHYYRVKGISLDPIHHLKKLLAVAKRHPKYAWLKDYDSQALSESIRHLGQAFSRFFKKISAFPRFKSRRSEQSSYHCQGVYVDGNSIKIPKMNRIKAVIHRPVEGKVKSITLKLDTCGDFFASILYDDGKAEPVKPKVVDESDVTGFDLGLKSFVTDSNGQKLEAPKAYRRAQKQLAKAQRVLSRKRRGSANREKARRRLVKRHRRIARIRADFLHKTSRKLVNENQALVFETLNISNMLKNHHLAGALSDAGWGEFVRMIEYKAKWKGRLVVKVDPWYPSSKTCSACGFKRDELDLSVRAWTCTQCGSVHDRDVNAAANLKAEGIRMLRANGLVVLRAASLRAKACGAGASPDDMFGCLQRSRKPRPKRQLGRRAVTSVKLGPSSVKSSVKIRSLMKERASICIREMAMLLGITTRAVEKQIARLRSEGVVRRVGSARSGRWEVLR